MRPKRIVAPVVLLLAFVSTQVSVSRGGDARARSVTTASLPAVDGERGPRGFTGPAGPRGPRGYRGYNGQNGWNGPTGATGQAGGTGATGPQGIQGVQGVTGPQGPQGATGANGPEGEQGPVGPAGEPGQTGPAGATWSPSVGVFYDTSIQTLVAANESQPMTLNKVTDGVGGAVARGVSVQTPGRITVSVAGTFNIQFSAQLDKTDAGTDLVNIWLALNGQNNPIEWTNTEVAVSSTGKSVAAWNFVLDLAANDYVQLMWSSPDSAMRLFSQPAQIAPVRPGIPSLIVSVTQVA